MANKKYSDYVYHIFFQFHLELSCRCTDLTIGDNGNCKTSPSIAKQGTGNVCYVQRPSNCYDLDDETVSGYEEEQYSAQACSIGICIAIVFLIKLGILVFYEFTIYKISSYKINFSTPNLVKCKGKDGGCEGADTDVTKHYCRDGICTRKYFDSKVM